MAAGVAGVSSHFSWNATKRLECDDSSSSRSNRLTLVGLETPNMWSYASKLLPTLTTVLNAFCITVIVCDEENAVTLTVLGPFLTANYGDGISNPKYTGESERTHSRLTQAGLFVDLNSDCL